jgi:hypothetical protein
MTTPTISDLLIRFNKGIEQEGQRYFEQQKPLLGHFPLIDDARPAQTK